MYLFSAARPEPLGRLRCAEDLFAVVAYSRPRGTREKALENVRGATRAAPYVESALQARVKLMPGSHSGARLKFRVIARIAGQHEFQRAEFKRAVERGISERGDRSWRLDEENAEVEFWATLLHDEMFLALRLSNEHLRHRDYKAAHIPGSLRPSVAAALCVLASPHPDDIVLDPFCGAGTVLIERAHLARYRKLIGGDIDQPALDAAHLNIGPRYKPIEIHPWDAAAVPMPDRSVSRIITNLPWGTKHGSHANNRRLYPRVLEEFARLLKPNGIAVMLTSERQLMNGSLRSVVLRPARVVPVSILGRSAAIYVCRKPD
jgi:23S rRNA G2445 N2-methylase RlmL